MISYTIIFEMKPKACPRPRLGKFGTFNPKDYTAWKYAFGLIAKQHIKKPITGPVTLEILFQFKKSKYWSKKKKAAANWHTQKSDIDNLQKSVLDALNGIAYVDDSQVCDLSAMKVWGDEDQIQVFLMEIVQKQ